MQKYKVFISHRHKDSINANLVIQSIINKTDYPEQKIFLDSQNIGPEHFDDKLIDSIKNAGCVVLIVTQDCFKPTSKDDWFIKEIKTAIKSGKTIIPILFNNIDSLSDKEIIKDLKLSFTQGEIDILTKFQSIQYNQKYPDASTDKLAEFVVRANDKLIEKLTKYIFTSLGVIILCCTLLFGIGVLWGFFTSSTSNSDIMTKNTTINGSTMHFTFENINAYYDLDKDTIIVDALSEGIASQTRLSNKDIIVSSFTVVGIKSLLNKNISYLKNLKFLSKGSKATKIVSACAFVVGVGGCICGFSQGCNFGKIKKQEDAAFSLYSQLANRDIWVPVIQKNPILSHKFILCTTAISNSIIEFDDEFAAITLHKECQKCRKSYKKLKEACILNKEEYQQIQWNKILCMGNLLSEEKLSHPITPEIIYADIVSMLTIYQSYHPESKHYVASSKLFYKQVSEAKLPYAGVIIFAFKDNATHPFFKEGDIVIEYDNQKVKSHKDLSTLYKRNTAGNVVFLRLNNGKFDRLENKMEKVNIVGFLELTE